MPGDLLPTVLFFIYSFFILFTHSRIISLFSAILHVNLVARLWNLLRRAILLCVQNIYIWGLFYDYILKYFSIKISPAILHTRPLEESDKTLLYHHWPTFFLVGWFNILFFQTRENSYSSTSSVLPLIWVVSSVYAHMWDFKCKRRRVRNRFSQSPSGSLCKCQCKAIHWLVNAIMLPGSKETDLKIQT